MTFRFYVGISTIEYDCVDSRERCSDQSEVIDACQRLTIMASSFDIPIFRIYSANRLGNHKLNAGTNVIKSNVISRGIKKGMVPRITC